MKWIIIVFLFILLLLTVILFNPLRYSADTIRGGLEKAIPIGSHIDDVEQVLQRMYPSQMMKSSLGFYKVEGGGLAKTVGVSSIRVHLGEYWSLLLFRTAVDAFFGFDENGRLVEIWVWKNAEGI
jgi:hypothetical protein